MEAVLQKLSKKKANEISLDQNKIVASDYETAPVVLKKREKKITNKRKRPEQDEEDMAEFLAKTENGNLENLGTKEEYRKKNKEDTENATNEELAIKQESYKKAVAKAKQQSKGVYAKPVDEYDEIEAAINRQKLLMHTSETTAKKGEEAVEAFMSLNKKIAEEESKNQAKTENDNVCLLYTSPSPRDLSTSRMPSSA
eukprot:TRINITY_DN3125_c0_g2_i3.p3 TRINITY_DN3125_c0_g2~~TRINITY_DN3125_c0_g2_i3.p3  ORF type:complete len:198 (+),score=99.91 TRINITY_DN3125_c0_g2_i3:366-959(+)